MDELLVTCLIHYNWAPRSVCGSFGGKSPTGSGRRPLVYCLCPCFLFQRTLTGTTLNSAPLLNPTGLDPAWVSYSGVCEPHVQPPLQENSSASPFSESTSEGLFSITTVGAWNLAQRSKLARSTSCGILWLQLPPSLLLADISVRFTCTICRSGLQSEV